jgi:hypothetical protein
VDRLTLGVVVGVLGLVVAGLVTAAVLGGREPRPDLSTPSGVVLAYALAQQRGDGTAAWDLLASSVQARNNRDQFLARSGGRGNDREYLTTDQEVIDASGASVVLVRTSAASGGIFGSNAYSSRSTVRLTHEAAGWRITVPPDAYLLRPSGPQGT